MDLRQVLNLYVLITIRIQAKEFGQMIQLSNLGLKEMNSPTVFQTVQRTIIGQTAIHEDEQHIHLLDPMLERPVDPVIVRPLHATILAAVAMTRHHHRPNLT
jgi:hypothetical protein